MPNRPLLQITHRHLAVTALFVLFIVLVGIITCWPRHFQARPQDVFGTWEGTVVLTGPSSSQLAIQRVAIEADGTYVQQFFIPDQEHPVEARGGWTFIKEYNGIRLNGGLYYPVYEDWEKGDVLVIIRSDASEREIRLWGGADPDIDGFRPFRRVYGIYANGVEQKGH